jgi:hypothetical protein
VDDQPHLQTIELQWYLQDNTWRKNGKYKDDRNRASFTKQCVLTLACAIQNENDGYW